MSDEVPGAAGSDNSAGGFYRELWKAFAVITAAVCVGGMLAIAEVTRGTPTSLGLGLMGVVVAGGAVVAFVLVQRAWRHHVSDGDRRMSRRAVRRASRAEGRALRRARSEQSGVLLEQKLSARYGVPVQRVAWHVWLINGELVEATLDPATGYLIAGGRELSL